MRSSFTNSVGCVGRIGVPALLVLWAAVLLLVSSTLMAGHWLALPAPAPADSTLQRALAQLGDGGRPGWQLVHVLFSECRCSQRIWAYLRGRPTPAGAAERLLLVGRDDTLEEQARRRGLAITRLTPDELRRRFAIESAPLLVVVDPAGAVRYVGGYTRQPQGIDYQDIQIFDDVREGRAPSALAVSGCAVSRALQSQLDPIGVKYRR